MSKVGEWFFKLRHQRQLRLKDVADALGTSRAFISQIESGSKLFPEKLMEATSQLFNVSMDEIASHLNTDKSVIKIKKALRSINFSNKEQITAIARTLSDEGLIDPIQKIVDLHGDAKGKQE